MLSPLTPRNRNCLLLAFGLAAAFALRPASGCSTEAPSAKDAAEIGRKLFTHVWTISEGLGPEINARSCAGCHESPSVGGRGTDQRSLVIVAPDALDPAGGHVFRRLRVSPTGAVNERSAPANGSLRRPPSLFGSGLIENIA